MFEIKRFSNRDTAILLEKLRTRFGTSLASTPPPLSSLHYRVQPNGTLTAEFMETNLLELYYRELLDADDADKSIKVHTITHIYM